MTAQLLVVAPLFVRRLWPTAVFVLVGVLAATTSMETPTPLVARGRRGARELYDGRPQPRSDPRRGPRARRCRVDHRGVADPGRRRPAGSRAPVRRGRPGVAAGGHRSPAAARGDRPVGGQRAGPPRCRGARSRRRRRGAADDGPRAPRRRRSRGQRDAHPGRRGAAGRRDVAGAGHGRPVDGRGDGPGSDVRAPAAARRARRRGRGGRGRPATRP